MFGVRAGPCRVVAKCSGVAPGSQAERVGLDVGDVILRYDGREIRTRLVLARSIEAAKATGRGSVAMVVASGAEEREVRVAPGVLGVGLEEFEEQ